MTPATLRHHRRGQTLVVFAIVLALVLVGMVALIADLGAVFTTYTRADNLALLAAQSGAAAIDTNALYQGRVVLAPDAARARCADVVRPATGDFQCSVDAAHNRVDAEVRMTPRLPLPIWLGRPVDAKRSAYAVYGGETGAPPP
jgi:hypothetical protein